jgi:hypothetical protein
MLLASDVHHEILASKKVIPEIMEPLSDCIENANKF